MNRAAIETPVTDPIVISTRLGGTVSVCAPVADSSATRSPSLAPRCFISGNSAGAIAAMSAAFDPEMPETRYIAPTSTYESPPRTWPSSPARNAIMALAMPVISISSPRKTNSGTARRIRCDIPSSMRPTITGNAVSVPSARYPNVPRPNAKAIGIPLNTAAATTPTKKISRLNRPRSSNRPWPSAKAPTRVAHDHRGLRACAPVGNLQQAQDGKQDHQTDADR